MRRWAETKTVTTALVKMAKKVGKELKAEAA
jgi:hypothetical protein